MRYPLTAIIFFTAMVPLPAFCQEKEDHTASLSSRVITNQSQPAVEKQFLLINPSPKVSAVSPKLMKKSSVHAKTHQTEGDNKFHRYHGYSHQDIEAVILPSGFKSVTTPEGFFYYNNGVFYQLVNYNLLPVNAPIGAVIDDLPTARVSKTIEGNEYYIYKNVYYIMTPEGHFQVVDPPFLELNELEEMIDPDSP